MDCEAMGAAGYAIHGSLAEIRSNTIEIYRRAQFILVVENDALLNTLVEENFSARTPCVMVTGKGFPDVATRMFLKKMVDTNKPLKVFIMCDFNPRCGGVYV